MVTANTCTGVRSSYGIVPYVNGAPVSCAGSGCSCDGTIETCNNVAKTITIDGGMPEHGHGLPTRPRVTKDLGNGSFEISGVRFNMGGWWELKLTIQTPAGTDTVTFNLSV